MSVSPSACPPNAVPSVKLIVTAASDYSGSYLWQWLQKEGAELSSHLPSFGSLEQPFLEVNRLGIEALNYKALDDQETALRALQNMENASGELMTVLSHLEGELNKL